MKIFKKRNTSNPKQICPICKTNDEGETVLLPIYGTEDDHIAQAEQFHLQCLDLVYYPKDKAIFQKIHDTTP